MGVKLPGLKILIKFYNTVREDEMNESYRGARYPNISDPEKETIGSWQQRMSDRAIRNIAGPQEPSWRSSITSGRVPRRRTARRRKPGAAGATPRRPRSTCRRAPRCGTTDTCSRRHSPCVARSWHGGASARSDPPLALPTPAAAAAAENAAQIRSRASKASDLALAMAGCGS